jgi:subtilase family serine protease
MNGVGVGTTPCFVTTNPLCGPVNIPSYQSISPSVATGPLTFNQDGSVNVNGGNGASASNRNFPDVAMTASGFEVVINGRVLSESGTSLSSPLWAAFTALAAQRAGHRLGFLNPTLY